jgi:hypothetical protein
MHTSDDFAFRTSYAGQKQMAELALSLLTMRADTPAGEWVDDHFGTDYEKVWTDARSLAGGEADDDLFLSVLNLADVLLRLLVAATEVEQASWLARVRANYIDPIDSRGTGVWGPHELEV